MLPHRKSLDSTGKGQASDKKRKKMDAPSTTGGKRRNIGEALLSGSGKKEREKEKRRNKVNTLNSWSGI